MHFFKGVITMILDYWNKHQNNLINKRHIPAALLKIMDESISTNKIISANNFHYICEVKGNYYRLHRTPETFSYFNSTIASKIPNKVLRLDHLTHLIRTDLSWKRAIERYRDESDAEKKRKSKQRLPSITISCEIRKGKSRNALRDGDFMHTNLIQCDFDDPNIDVNLLLSKLQADPHIRCAFRSPSSKIKAFIRVSAIKICRDHKIAFDHVSTYCEKEFGIEIDTAPSAVGSLCYISHDPNAFIKDAIPLPWSYPTASIQQKRQQKRRRQTRKHFAKNGIKASTLGDFLNAHNVSILGEDTRNGGSIYYIECPWIGSHSTYTGERQSAVFEYEAGGHWCFRCFHQGCANKRWADFRQIISPKQTH